MAFVSVHSGRGDPTVYLVLRKKTYVISPWREKFNVTEQSGRHVGSFDTKAEAIAAMKAMNADGNT
jgi:hypothetical protein